jgi:anti-sigma B factor antagonist
VAYWRINGLFVPLNQQENFMSSLNPKIVVEYVEETAIVLLTDEKILEEKDIKALEQSIMPLVDQNQGKGMILDFSNVMFFSSSVLGLLIRISKKIYELDGQLRLCSISPKIFEIFRITRLDKVFEICDDRTKALRSMQY